MNLSNLISHLNIYIKKDELNIFNKYN